MRSWKKSESSKLWNSWLAGTRHERIAAELGRPSEEVERRIELFAYNERDLAIRYQPFYRVSRKGKPFTAHEKLIISEHKRRKVPLSATARLLARDVSEFNDDWKQVPAAKADAVLAKTVSVENAPPTLDVVMAHRYIFHVYKSRVISDKSYDALYKEEVEYGGGGPALNNISKHGFWGPPRIKTLALYLTQRYEDEHGKLPAKR